MDYCGRKRFSMMCTVQRSQLPQGIEPQYFQKEATKPGDMRAKVACFNKPITSVKHVKNKDGNYEYHKVHILFQSTSSCNIQCVNSQNKNMLFTRKKSHGMGDRKWTWVIKMNATRKLYLSTYGHIDTLDWLIQKCHLYFTSWKYWHSPKLHVDALALVVVYDMYKEVATKRMALDFFGIGKEEKLQVLDFHNF